MVWSYLRSIWILINVRKKYQFSMMFNGGITLTNFFITHDHVRVSLHYNMTKVQVEIWMISLFSTCRSTKLFIYLPIEAAMTKTCNLLSLLIMPPMPAFIGFRCDALSKFILCYHVNDSVTLLENLVLLWLYIYI